MSEGRTYNNSGILFKNFRKAAANHPDYQGSATVDGKKYRLGAWIKNGRKGKFMSVAFTLDVPKEQDPVQDGPASDAGEPGEPPEEGKIPF